MAASASSSVVDRRAWRSVVHINEKGGSFGGTEEYITLLTSALAGRGVQSHLVCGLVAGDASQDLSSVHVVEGLRSRRPRPGTGDAVAAVVREIDPDVIYLHNVFDPAVVSSLAALEGRGALLWYVHDHYLTCLTELRWRRDVGSCAQRLGRGCLTAIDEGHCVRRFPQRTLDLAELEDRTTLAGSLCDVDAVVVVSGYMRSLLEEAEPRLGARLHLLRRPVRVRDSRRTRQRSRASDPAVVLAAGRITAEKGLSVLLEALGAVTTDRPVELRIAGIIEDDHFWSECRRIGDEAMAVNARLSITYLGHLDYEAMDEQLTGADIVVIPSQWPEPLGAVALEAMAAGSAVVASRIGGLDTVLVDHHNGLLIEPDDVAAWTDAITSLLAHPERARRLRDQAHRDMSSVEIEHHIDALDEIRQNASG